MRWPLAMLLLAGCRLPPLPEPAAEPPPPQCVPKLQQGIVQMRDVSEPVPGGATADTAFDAMTDYLTSIGVAVVTADRAKHEIVSRSFAGEAVEWSCDMREYRQYAYRIAVTGEQWTVRLDCERSFGWDAHMSGSTVVPEDHGVLVVCSDAARYTSQLDSQRARNLVDGARKVLEQRAHTASP